MGDFQYKTRKDLPPEAQKVSCFPDITIHERTADDDILILACDGLWDVYSSSEVVDLAREVMLGGETSPMMLAEELIDSALDKGSKDNISCIVAHLPGVVLGNPSLGGVIRRRADREKLQNDLLEADRKRREERAAGK